MNIFIEYSTLISKAIDTISQIKNNLDTPQNSIKIKTEINKTISHLKNLITSNPSVNAFSQLSLFDGSKNSIRNLLRILQSEAISSYPKGDEKVFDQLSSYANSIENIGSSSKLTEQQIIEQFEIYRISEDISSSQAIEPNSEKQKIELDYLILNKLIESQREKIEKIAQETDAAIKNATNAAIDFSEFIETETPKIKSRLATTNQLFSEAGGVKLAEHYLNQANIEEQSANFYRTCSFICLFLGFIFLSLLSTTNIFSNINSTIPLIARIFAQVSLLVFSSAAITYLIKESNKHRLRHNSLNNKYLALSTIDLYLSPLDKTAQDQIKTELSTIFFASETSSKTNTSEEFGFNPQETINKLISLIEKLPDKKS